MSISTSLSRRGLLGAGSRLFVAATLGSFISPRSFGQPSTTTRSPRRMTLFYQFNRQAFDALRTGDGLGNDADTIHIFSNSSPGRVARPELANLVHSAGSSFKFACAFDLQKYQGWASVPDDQLKQWATEFRQRALSDQGPSDYFGFNEFPTSGCSNPRVRGQIAKLVRYLHSGDAGPPLPGVFFMTERNLDFRKWDGETDSFFDAINVSCDFVVGEHYHSYAYVTSKSPSDYAQHLFEFPKWLLDRKAPSAHEIARDKFLVLHSSYYGPDIGAWAGVDSSSHPLSELQHYIDALIHATRAHSLGKDRIAFGPLLAKNFDPRIMPLLAASLAKDLREKKDR
jgi:hypothetical protein